MAGLGVPLSSNNKANPYTPIGGSSGPLAGVTSLNGQSGNLAIVGDSSIGVTAIGSGQLQVSTAGRPQNVGAITTSSVSATGAVSGSTVSASGAVTGATVAATGAVTGASVAATGAVTGATVAATGAVTGASFTVPSTQSLSLNNPTGNALAVQPIQSFIAPQVYAVPAAGASTAISVPALNALLAQPGFHLIAIAVNLPYVDQTNLANVAAGLVGMISLRNYGNSGGGQAPLIAGDPFATAGMAIAFTATGPSGTSPYVATITNPGGATQAGTISILQLC